MKKFFATGGLIGLAIVGAVLLAVGVASGVGARAASYEIRSLTETFSPQDCATAKGKAALVADINEHGELVTEWQASCLVEVK